MLAALPFVPAFLGERLLSWNLDPPAETRAHTGADHQVGMADVQRVREATEALAVRPGPCPAPAPAAGR